MTMFSDLTGQVAFITGGTRGIGAACVRTFAEAGATVAYCGAGPAAAHDSERIFGFTADLAEPRGPHKAVAEVIARFGRIDILVNNAGVFDTTDLFDVTPENWDHIHAINLRAAFFCTQQAAMTMKDSGGTIINMSSIAGQNGGSLGNPAYASSKAAIIGLTKAMARRLAKSNIRVNCLAPADIETDMTAGWPDEIRQKLIGITPLQRFGSVDEVSEVAAFLCSSSASYITGQVISINGGAFMSG